MYNNAISLTVITILILLLVITPTQTQSSSYQNQDRSQKILSSNQHRVALVIGNINYYNYSKLKNPINDAKAVKEKFENLGFEVIYKTDLGREGFKQALDEFEKVMKQGAISVFYYAGHGVQIDGKNYLIPIDAKIRRKRDVELEAIGLNLIVETMQITKDQAKVIILDACRTNPFTTEDFRNTQDGLAPISVVPKNMFIGFATSPGKVASDGNEVDNSPYTAALLKWIGKPCMELGETFIEVCNDVAKNTNDEQIPWKADSLTKKFYLAGDCGVINSNNSSTNVSSNPDLSSVVNSNTNPTTPLRLDTYNFTYPVVDITGKEVEKGKGQAKYYEQKLQQYTKIEMVYIPGGAFKMGSPKNELGREKDEKQHEVRVTPFYIGKYEITRLQWQIVARMEKVEIDLDEDPSFLKHKELDDYPVTQVTWQECMEFCKRLSRYSQKTYRLPTEAEWEYACRAGTTTPFAFGESLTTSLASYDGNIPYGRVEQKGINEIALKMKYLPNQYGLYQMHGNVWEWCLNWYDEYPLDNIIIENPVGPTIGEEKILRGGSWISKAVHCRSANRHKMLPNAKESYIGFRIVSTTK